MSEEQFVIVEQALNALADGQQATQEHLMAVLILLCVMLFYSMFWRKK